MPEEQTNTGGVPTSSDKVTPWSFEASQYDDHACVGRLMFAVEQFEESGAGGIVAGDTRTRSEDPDVLRQLFSDVSDWLDDDHEDCKLDELSGRAVIALQRLLDQVAECLDRICMCGHEHVDEELEYARENLDEMLAGFKDAYWGFCDGDKFEAFDACDIRGLLGRSHRGQGFTSFEVEVDADATITVNCDGGREVRAYMISGSEKRSLVDLAREIYELDDELLCRISQLTPEAAAAVELLCVDGGAALAELIDVTGYTGILDNSHANA